jgi:hypothetical protein
MTPRFHFGTSFGSCDGNRCMRNSFPKDYTYHTSGACTFDVNQLRNLKTCNGAKLSALCSADTACNTGCTTHMSPSTRAKRDFIQPTRFSNKKTQIMYTLVNQELFYFFCCQERIAKGACALTVFMHHIRVFQCMSHVCNSSFVGSCACRHPHKIVFAHP